MHDELDEREFEQRGVAEQIAEARAGHFNRIVEIEDAQFGAEFHVVFDGKFEGVRFAVCFFDFAFGFVFAFGGGGVREIREGEKDGVQFGFDFLLVFVPGFFLFPDFFHSRDGGGFFFSFEFGDFFIGRVFLCAKSFDRFQQFPIFFIQFYHLLDFGGVHVALFEVRADAVRVSAKKVEVEHGFTVL